MQLVLNLTAEGQGPLSNVQITPPGGLDFTEATGEELVLPCFLYLLQAPLQAPYPHLIHLD